MRQLLNKIYLHVKTYFSEEVSNDGKNGKKENFQSKVDRVSYTSNQCTIGRTKEPGWGQIIMEKPIYVVAKR